MGVALVQPFHGVVHHDAHAHGSGKEQQGIEQHLTQTRAGAAACAQHAGEHHDADDVIDDGSADDGGAEEALQVAHLLHYMQDRRTGRQDSHGTAET